jgi:hypothetical protein
MDITSFDGKYSFLSNFYESPITDKKLVFSTFPTVEHYYQAAKTTSLTEYFAIATADTPGKAKRLGQKCQIRPDWEEKKDDVMRTALKLKFSNPELKQKLLDTGDSYLVEGNTWHDREWGVCFCSRCERAPGKNKLGRMLMDLREELKESDT